MANKVKIISGIDEDVMSKKVNDFCEGKNVFATQHSTVYNQAEDLIIYTFVVFYKE